MRLVCLLAINQHPQPVDDCPCFEDAIAVGSVMVGALVGRWGMMYFGLETVGVQSKSESAIKFMDCLLRRIRGRWFMTEQHR